MITGYSQKISHKVNAVSYFSEKNDAIQLFIMYQRQYTAVVLSIDDFNYLLER